MAIKKSAYQWPGKLRLITMNEAVVWENNLDLAHSWSDLLETDTGIKVHIALENDTVDRWRWIGRLKLFDLATAAPFEIRRMLMTEPRYCVRDGGPFPVRIAWVNSKGNSGFFTRGDSPIKTPRDIKSGTRLCHMTYVGSQKMVDSLLAWAGVKSEDIIWVDVANWEENCQAVVEGQADLGLGVPTSFPIQRAEKSPEGLGWLDLNPNEDPEGARRFWESDPLFHFGPMHTGVASAIGHWGMIGINFELTRADVDPQLIYNLAKWFDTNHERFKDKHLLNRFRNRETLVEGLRHTFVPCHDGLIAYLKDLGVWTKAHDRRQQENQALVDGYAEAYQECMRRADEKGIWVARENEEWVKFWVGYRKANLQELKPFHDLPKAASF